ncbi:MAG: hypothetical protein K2P94_06865 [Rhodospirillaceae bacterium]|nr:hypothetical protein [Rhodospirillaceae bacterium]
MQNTPIPTAPIAGALEKPSFLLRVMAKVLLSQWVINRVTHPQILMILGSVARQVGRMDIIMKLHAKSQDMNV